jgi:hypothetical protein
VFCRVLLDAIEKRTKRASESSVIAALFRGKVSVIVDSPAVGYGYDLDRFEDLFDLSMLARCCRDLDPPMVKRKRFQITVRHHI